MRSFLSLSLCALGSAVFAGEKSVPVSNQPVVVVKGDDCSCGDKLVRLRQRDGIIARRAARKSSCASTATVVTEQPAVIRTESVYQTRKVGEKVTIVPAASSSTKGK